MYSFGCILPFRVFFIHHQMVYSDKPSYDTTKTYEQDSENLPSYFAIIPIVEWSRGLAALGGRGVGTGEGGGRHPFCISVTSATAV